MKFFKIKIIVASFILFFACTQIVADEYKDALKRAEKEDKPIVLYFYSSFCGFCDLMDRDVLNDKEIEPMLKKDVVYVKISVDKSTELPRRYGVRGYPTISLLDPSGRRIVQIPGYVPKNDFKRILQFLKGKHYKMMTFGEFMDGWKH